MRFLQRSLQLLELRLLVRLGGLGLLLEPLLLGQRRRCRRLCLCLPRPRVRQLLLLLLIVCGSVGSELRCYLSELSQQRDVRAPARTEARIARTFQLLLVFQVRAENILIIPAAGRTQCHETRTASRRGDHVLAGAPRRPPADCRRSLSSAALTLARWRGAARLLCTTSVRAAAQPASVDAQTFASS